MTRIDDGIHMKGGVITERDSTRCSVRTRIPGGVIGTQQLQGIVAIAERYGQEWIHLTTRQTIEIPHIDPSRLDQLAADLSANGTPIGSERDEVVNITACPGSERCKFATIDTLSLARALDVKLFGKEMPVKIRIAISGCPNACTSPLLSEIGVIGRNTPERTPGICTGCGTCVEYCKEGAIKIWNGISVLNPDLCVQCGSCIHSCPFGSLSSAGGHFLITVGGRRGRHPRLGRELINVATADEVVAVVERVVGWVYRRAWSGRLLCEQLDDLKFDEFKTDIAGAVQDVSPI
ncbi:MAG: 4Fe-4S binding protein [Methanomicrobiales archaeon]|nr:4Fe-4S binding protein [Methanomicrobiales archaeon]